MDTLNHKNTDQYPDPRQDPLLIMHAFIEKVCDDELMIRLHQKLVKLLRLTTVEFIDDLTSL